MCLGLPRGSNSQLDGDPPGPVKLFLFGLAFVAVMGFIAIAGRLRRATNES